MIIILTQIKVDTHTPPFLYLHGNRQNTRKVKRKENNSNTAMTVCQHGRLAISQNQDATATDKSPKTNTLIIVQRTTQ